MNTLGWLGSICLALCGLPQAIQCIKADGCKDINIIFLILWLSGEVLCFVPIIVQIGWVPWLVFNYGFNIILVSIILYYRCK